MASRTTNRPIPTSFGVLLYEIMAAKLPHERVDTFQVVMGVITKRLPRPELPSECEFPQLIQEADARVLEGGARREAAIQQYPRQRRTRPSSRPALRPQLAGAGARTAAHATRGRSALQGRTDARRRAATPTSGSHHNTAGSGRSGGLGGLSGEEKNNNEKSEKTHSAAGEQINMRFSGVQFSGNADAGLNHTNSNPNSASPFWLVRIGGRHCSREARRIGRGGLECQRGNGCGWRRRWRSIGRPAARVAVALVDHVGQAFEELSFKRGDTIRDVEHAALHPGVARLRRSHRSRRRRVWPMARDAPRSRAKLL